MVTAAPADILQHGRALQEYEQKRAPLQAKLDALIAPYKDKLFDERVASLPAEIQIVIRKPERERSVEEQKLADDYYPILRIDLFKVREIMPKQEYAKVQEVQRELAKIVRPPDPGPTVYFVEEDEQRLSEKSYILTTGDPMRPEKDHEVQSGFPSCPRSSTSEMDGVKDSWIGSLRLTIPCSLELP